MKKCKNQNNTMVTEFLKKLESYSYTKQFWILFFIATIDVWVMPILSILIYATGLDEVSFFKATYTSFLWNKSGAEIFDPIIITDFAYYYIYIYSSSF